MLSRTKTIWLAVVAVAVTAAVGVAVATDDDLEVAGAGVAEDSEPRMFSTAEGSLGAIGRDEIINRAQYWYQQSNGDPGFVRDLDVYPPDPEGRGYRSDCSGLVSMAWKLPTSYSTGTLPEVAFELDSLADLRRGDILLAQKDDAHRYGHVAIFDKWADAGMTTYWGYDHGGGRLKYQTYAVQRPDDSRVYLPYRYDNVTDEAGGPVDAAQPHGDINTVTGGTGEITVWGWAADPDTPTAGVSVHVYLTTPGGDRSLAANIPASETREDVAQVHPQYGAAHGYTATIGGLAAGRYQVEVFATDSSGTPDDYAQLSHAGAVSTPVDVT